VTEQRVKRRPVQAQSTAIARAVARICNNERASFGVMSGHDRKTLSALGLVKQAKSLVEQALQIDADALDGSASNCLGML